MITMQLANEAYKLSLQYAAKAPIAPSHLVCAKRDSAAFQVILNADEYYSVRTSRGEWFSARGDKHITGKKEHIRLRLDVKAPFPVRVQLEEFLTDDDNVQKADMLLNTDVRESDPHKPTGVWVEANVPADATPGEYEINVSLYASKYFEDEKPIASATMPLRIMDHTLPVPTERRFYLDLWQHTSNIARKHDVALWSDAHFAVLAKYADTLAALGQRSITVCVSEIPWAGQSCFEYQEFGGNLFEFSMVSITRGADGVFRYDFSAMQRYIDLCTAVGISGDIEVFGLVNIWTRIPNQLCEEHPECIRIRYYDEVDGCMKYMRTLSDITDYTRAIEQYFIKTGQIERVRVAADEPSDVEKYRKSLDLLHEVAPAFRLKTAINHVEFIGEFGDRIDDFVPHLRAAFKGFDDLQYYREKYPEKRYLWYVCTGSIRPNQYLRAPLTECRMVGPLTSAFRFDGFLRWNYTVWPEDPRREIRASRWEAGDTNFVYPAYNGDVLLSLRYKNLQRGLADHEILESLRDRLGDAAVTALVGRVLHITDPATYYQLSRTDVPFFAEDWEIFNTVKEEALALLCDAQ